VLTSGKEIILFQSRFFGGKLPSGVTFARSVLKKYSYRLWLTVLYASINVQRISQTIRYYQDMSAYFMCAFDLNAPRRLANCRANISFCDKTCPIDIFPAGVLFCTKRSHNGSKNNQCKCKLCVKTGPANLKSLCVNKLWSLPSKYHKQKL